MFTKQNFVECQFLSSYAQNTTHKKLGRMFCGTVRFEIQTATIIKIIVF